MSGKKTEKPIIYKRIAGGYMVGPAAFVATNGRDYLHMLLLAAKAISKQVSCSGLEMKCGDQDDGIEAANVSQDLGVHTHAEGSMSSHQPESDGLALSRYRVRVRELENMDSLEPVLASELNFLKYELDKATFKGKPKGFTDEKEKSRQRVTHALRLAINGFIEHPDTLDIGLHLHDFVTTGYECCYTGDQEWKL